MKKYLLTFGLIAFFLFFGRLVNAQTGEEPVDLLVNPEEEVKTEEDLIAPEESLPVEEESISLFDIYQVEEELADPGLLPNHPLYFLKTLSENIGTFFTFGQINRVNRQMFLAERRLAEAELLLAQGETERAEKMMNRYQKRFARALVLLERAKEDGQNTDEAMVKIAEKTLRHQMVLSRVYNQVPEQAKDAIRQAMENSLRDYERTIETIPQEEVGEEMVREVLKRIKENRPAIEDKINRLQRQGTPTPDPSLQEEGQGVELNLVEEDPGEVPPRRNNQNQETRPREE